MRNIAVRANAFAAHCHGSIGQLRKYTHEPYLVHPESVAAIVRCVAHTPAMVAAAYLHDTVEDTPVTLGEIMQVFGTEVAAMVDWLTEKSHPGDGNRAARKAKECARLAEAPADVQTIKLADLIDNSATIIHHDPKFARVYLPEKAALLRVLRKGDLSLWLWANEILPLDLRVA